MKWKHVVVFLLAVAGGLQPGVASAQGGGKGWLERLSGPGPFDGWQYYVRLACFSGRDEGPTHVSWLWSRKNADDVQCLADRGPNLKGTLVLNFGHWTSQDNLLAPAGTPEDVSKVDFYSFEPALMIRLKPALEVGAGFGLNWFSGNAFDTFFRGSVTPVKIVFKPLAIAGGDPRLGVFRLVGQTTRFATGFTEQDFCQPPRCPVVYDPFSVKGEFLWSVSALFDFGVFLK